MNSIETVEGPARVCSHTTWGVLCTSVYTLKYAATNCAQRKTNMYVISLFFAKFTRSVNRVLPFFPISINFKSGSFFMFGLKWQCHETFKRSKFAKNSTFNESKCSEVELFHWKSKDVNLVILALYHDYLYAGVVGKCTMICCSSTPPPPPREGLGPPPRDFWPPTFFLGTGGYFDPEWGSFVCD